MAAAGQAPLALGFGLGLAPRLSHFALDVHTPQYERAGAIWKLTRFGNAPPRAYAHAGVGLNCGIF